MKIVKRVDYDGFNYWNNIYYPVPYNYGICLFNGYSIPICR